MVPCMGASSEEDQHCLLNTCRRKLLLNKGFIFTMLHKGDI